jgi:phosphoribosylformylglycinamidine synthase
VRATVLVRPKEGILDPQGEAVEGSLRKLGFEVKGVRVGRVIDLELSSDGADDARAQV